MVSSSVAALKEVIGGRQVEVERGGMGEGHIIDHMCYRLVGVWLLT